MFEKIAKELKTARENSGLTLQQLSAKSRIDLKYLEALEIGNFNFLPDLYVKAFVKDYCKMVNLDVDEILKKYEAAKIGKDYEELKREQEQRDLNTGENKNAVNIPETSKPSEKTFVDPSASAKTASSGNNFSKQFLTIGGIAAVVIVVFTVVYFLFLQGGSKIVVEEKPLEEVISSNNQRYVQQQKDSLENTSNNIATADSLALTIKVTDTCWVQIIQDDKKIEEYTLFPNSQKTLNANNNFKLTIGNSGATELLLNNKNLDYKGKPNAVSYVLVDKDGYKKLYTQPVLN